jgi:hypothetical protein
MITMFRLSLAKIALMRPSSINPNIVGIYISNFVMPERHDHRAKYVLQYVATHIMVVNFNRGQFPYNTLRWRLISWDLSHLGSAYPFLCRMHVIFWKAWSRNSIKLYMRNMRPESSDSVPRSFIWVKGLANIEPKPSCGLDQICFWSYFQWFTGPGASKLQWFTRLVNFLLCQWFTAIGMNWLDPECIGPTWRGRGESLRRRARSQWILVAMPVCHLQCPAAYLSHLQRIQLVTRSEGSFEVAHHGLLVEQA